jgi:hypothetical protein
MDDWEGHVSHEFNSSFDHTYFQDHGVYLLIIILILLIIIKKINCYYTIKGMDDWEGHVSHEFNSSFEHTYFQGDGVYFTISWDVLYYIRMFRIL